MVYLVHRTDKHHSYATRDLIAVATSQKKAITLIKRAARLEGHRISTEELEQLDNMRQTQGWAGSGEFTYEEVDTNVILG